MGFANRQVPPAEAAGDPGAMDRARQAAMVLWAFLAILAIARAVLAFVPAMWGWGLNHQRFLAPGWAWGPWVLATLALIPALSRPLAGRPATARASGARRKRSGLRPSIGLWAVAAATLVWFLPDAVRSVGDFLLRQGTLERAAAPGRLFPQALPLDVLLHYTLPLSLAQSGLLEPHTAARMIGAVSAAALAFVAVALTRVLHLRGVAALACGAALFFGGHIAMFTGYSKAFVDLSVLTAAAGVLALRVVRTGNGVLLLGLVVAASLLVHRSALALLPGAGVAGILWLRSHGRRGAWRRPDSLAGFVLPFAALAWTAPRIAASARAIDRGHLDPRGGGPLAMWAEIFGTEHLADAANLIFLLAPLGLAVPVLAWVLGPTMRGRPEPLFLLAWVAPFLALLFLVHPRQGPFRDWDVFASSGIALSVAAAWWIGETLRSAPGLAWVGVAVALGVAAPALQWLVHHSDLERGLARVEAFATEPPQRSERHRGSAWDFLGIRLSRLERWEEAARAFRRAAEVTPSPRVLMQLAYAESRAGNLAAAQQVFRRLVERTPEDPSAWGGLAVVAARRGDVVESRRAATELLKRDPGNREALRILGSLDATPGNSVR